MDHEMGNTKAYSLVPQKNDSQFVSHYRVEKRTPRFVAWRFTDCWVTTHHRMQQVGDAEIHFSQTFFNPERAYDKLYFSRGAKHRIEIIVPGRFIEDREIYDLLRDVVPTEYQIGSLLQRQP